MKKNVTRIFTFKIALTYIAQFLGMGGFLVFFAAWLAFNGLSEVQIALILSVSLLTKSLFAPFGALFADGFLHKKTPLLLMNILTVVSLGLFYFVDEYFSIFIVAIFHSIASAAIMPVLDGLSVKGAERLKFDYGHVRLWGSLAFIVSSILTGVIIEKFGFVMLIPWLFFAGISALIVGLFLPTLPAEGEEKATVKNLKFDLRGALALLKNPVFITILVVVSIIFASHAVYYGFSVIHWQRIGYSERLIGMLWGAGVLAEVLLFVFSAKFIEYFGPRKLLILCGLAAVIRWGITVFDPPLYLLFFAQSLHAFTFAASFLAGVYLITRSVPEHLIATAMAINASLGGIFLALALLVAGFLYAEYFALSYWFSVGLGVLGLIIALGLKFIWDGEKLDF